ncbi:MAG: endonuclease [Paludibacter sp.]|nr:endonuclease [Paludibacter sp.]
MTFHRYSRIPVVLFLISLLVSGLWAQEPTGYYSDAEGENKAELKTALHNIIRNHTYLDYDISTNIWWYTYFKETDWSSEGYFLDMYSSNKRATYNWNLMNREHCMPRSWWGTSDMYSTFDSNGDLVNLSPSDAEANTAKSNLPLGIVGTSSFTNGVTKVGSNTYPGYNGEVFEPANEYKGDFARTYMYMVTCYEDYAQNWRSLGTSSMLYNNTYPTFKPYAVSLLLKWSANDPVSEKEIVRNNAVYALQKNRNPFIDHPELADFIWGTRISEEWTLDVGPAETTVFAVNYNKSTDEISAEISKPELATYFIQSVNGIVLQSGKFSSTGTARVTELQNGMYILTVYSGTKRKVGKFLIVR